MVDIEKGMYIGDLGKIRGAELRKSVKSNILSTCEVNILWNICQCQYI